MFISQTNIIPEVASAPAVCKTELLQKLEFAARLRGSAFQIPIRDSNRFGFPKIGPFDSTTAWSLYAVFGCDCTVDGTAAGTKAGKMSVKTSICPCPPLFITKQ